MKLTEQTETKNVGVGLTRDEAYGGRMKKIGSLQVVHMHISMGNFVSFRARFFFFSSSSLLFKSFSIVLVREAMESRLSHMFFFSLSSRVKL